MATTEDLVLVTGASGFVAIHIVKQLLEEGYRVRGTVRSLTNEVKIAPLKRLVENPKYPLELVEADLLEDECWPRAVKDCAFVIHTASPFPNSNPDNENDVLEPAVNGTLRVLRACVGPESKVKRVVLTSSLAAIFTHKTPTSQKLSEKDWADPNFQDPYPKSKTLAEKAAWDFVNERKQKNEPCFELAVINAGYIMGPLLHDSYCSSMEILKKLIERTMPAIPAFSFAAIDVRDVALAHLRALTTPEAANNRHLIVINQDGEMVKDYANILTKELGPKGYSIPSRGLPSFLVKTIALVDKQVALVAPFLDKRYSFDNSRMKNVLGIEPRSVETSVIDMANSMIEKGMINNNK